MSSNRHHWREIYAARLPATHVRTVIIITTIIITIYYLFIIYFLFVVVIIVIFNFIVKRLHNKSQRSVSLEIQSSYLQKK